MEKEKLDENLFEYFKVDKNVPDKFHKDIFNTSLIQKSKNKIYSNFKKVAVILLSVSTMTAGTVFATQQFWKDIFNSSKGVETAIQNNYIEENLDTIAAESQNGRIEATHMLFDDNTLNISFLAQFNTDIDLTNKEKYFDIPDLIITDEKDDIIYYASMETAQEFLKQKGLKSERSDVINNRINAGITPLEISKTINKTACNFTLKCYADDINLPNCEKIYIIFNSMVFTENFQETTINGKWKIEITVPEKFKNREPQIYKQMESNDNSYKITNEIYPTCTKIGITINNIDYEKWHNRSDEIRRNGNISDSHFIKLENCYIENENGEKYYISNIPEHNYYGVTNKGELHAELIFDLTEFNLTSKLKVVLYTLENEELIINLEK